jgi:hypothetical protein
MKKLSFQLPKRKKQVRKNQSLADRLRELFTIDRLYTIDDLSKITGYKKNYVRSQVSILQNSDYTPDPINLVQKRGDDQIKRFGNPEATQICDLEKWKHLAKHKS